jgi:hypothetical protein
VTTSYLARAGQKACTVRIIPEIAVIFDLEQMDRVFLNYFLFCGSKPNSDNYKNVCERQRGAVFYSGVKVTIYAVIVETQQNSPN